MDEILAKKVKFAPVICFSMGIILIVLCIVCFIASALNEFDLDFLFSCVAFAGIGSSVIALGIHQSKIPTDLILANETCFVFLTTGEQIPFDSVCKVKSRYNERRIILVTTDGFEHFIDYVADYKTVKQLIAKNQRKNRKRYYG
jgi:hypothetical protein